MIKEDNNQDRWGIMRFLGGIFLACPKGFFDRLP